MRCRGWVAGLGPDAGGPAVGDEVYALIEFDRDGRPPTT